MPNQGAARHLELDREATSNKIMDVVAQSQSSVDLGAQSPYRQAR